MKNKILVLQGVPASGKSTFARELAAKDKSYVIVSRDEIREASGIYWVPEREDYITSVEDFQVTAALSDGLSVIIDATNLNPKTIDKWRLYANHHDCDIEFKLFEVDWKTALERDTKREKEGKRAVGKKVLERFFRKYFPSEPIVDERFVDTRKMINPCMGIDNDCVICDIDGTLALRTGRSPYDYTRVSTDKEDIRLSYLLSRMIKDTNTKLIFFSGRECVPNCYADTFNWLKKHLPYLEFDLYMREYGDHRNDAIIKKELYEKHIEGKYNVLCVFDDRQKVVDMWRDLGLLCCQVYYGDF